jgi:hypothetical protein
MALPLEQVASLLNAILRQGVMSGANLNGVVMTGV